VRVTVLAVGSRGDVQPYVALALGLRDAGHEVRVATHERFRPLVDGRGLEFAQIDGDPRAFVENDLGQAWLESGGSAIAFWRAFAPIVGRLFEDSVRSIVDACEGTEAVVHSALAFSGSDVAQSMRVPSLAALLQPANPTREFPTTMASPERRLPGALNRLTHVAANQAFWQLYRRPVNAWREGVGLPRYPFLGPYRQVRGRRHPVLYGFSPAVLPRPADWAPWLHVTGYWFLPEDQAWTPPARLEEFMATRPAPVCVGFGSMRPRDPWKLSDAVVRAVRRTRRRAVLQAGWADLNLTEDADDILVVEDVPHSWLFPRADAVVHHGGAGTTGAALRAGRPSVVAPFFADQFFWARRVARLGAGPAPVPQASLTAERLAAALERALNDAGMAERARALGRRIQAEDGVTRAAALFGAELSRG
jgi:sterol 3beta-glucosyltransferase